MFDFIQQYRNNGLNPVLLKFNNPQEEKKYIKDFIEHRIVQTRIIFVFALITCIIFFLFDIVRTNGDILPILVAMSIVIATAIILLILSTFKFYKEGVGLICQSISVLIYGSVSLLLTLNGPVTYFHHFNDIIYIFIFLFVILRITFYHALTISILLIILFQILCFQIGFSDMIIATEFHIMFCFIFSIVTGYVFESLSRKEYLMRCAYEAEQKQTLIKNMNLEQLVKDRTEELLKLNKNLKKAKLKAEGSERLKSTFLANISHEIRTPLTQIIGFSELLTKEGLTQEKRQQYAEYIDKNANKLLLIISDIIKLSEIESDQFKVIKSKFFLNDFFDELLIFAKEERHRQNKDLIKIDIQHVDKEITLETDKVSLRDIFVNLLNNAFKFTTTGKISITYRIRKDQRIEFCVEDTGKGIDAENTEFIFNHFSQEDESSTRNYGGTGMGLSISKGLAQRLGGKMWVRSEIGKGSAFYFTIDMICNK